MEKPRPGRLDLEGLVTALTEIESVAASVPLQDARDAADHHKCVIRG
jgi:hypothetical protein